MRIFGKWKRTPEDREVHRSADGRVVVRETHKPYGIWLSIWHDDKHRGTTGAVDATDSESRAAMRADIWEDAVREGLDTPELLTAIEEWGME